MCIRDRVGEHEVNHPEPSAEGNGRQAAGLGQLPQVVDEMCIRDREIIPANFNSAKAMWKMIQRLEEVD